LNREQILEQLKQERKRLDDAINALEGSGVTENAKKKGRRKGITAAGSKRLSEMMKKRWAERKKNIGKKK